MKTRPWIDRSELLTPSDPEAENAIAAASSVLFMLSGQRFGGVQEVTEQYTCETSGAPIGCAYDSAAGGYWNPAVGMYTFVVGRTAGPKRLGPGGSVYLNRRPARRILNVDIDGATVDPSQYDLINNSMFRPSASVGWGLCSSPTITYEYGVNPPAMGRLAARKLADEFILAFNGKECSLPSSVTSVSRQGMSFSIFDPQDFLDKGRVGLYEVDLFLQSYNPSKAAKRPKVFSPDMPRANRRS